MLIFPNVSLRCLAWRGSGSSLPTPNHSAAPPLPPAVDGSRDGGNGAGKAELSQLVVNRCQGLSVPHLSTNSNYHPRISTERTGKCGETELIIPAA